MGVFSKVFSLGEKAARPATGIVASPVKKFNPILKKAQETYGSVLLSGVRGDIAVIRRGRASDSPTIFARIGKDGELHTLKTKTIYKPYKLDNGNVLRRRIDTSMTKTLDGLDVQKTIRNDRLYNQDGLAKKERRVFYNVSNATNGHYTNGLPYNAVQKYDIQNGNYYKYIEATKNPSRLAYENGIYRCSP